MLLSLSWLREFVPYEGTAEDLGHKLTMAGLELDGLSRPYEALRPIVVGFVAECGRHPEADKLSVCRVDVGDEVLDIVCGAPNVAQGQKVAVVKVGSTLPSGLTIKKAKLRGAPSCGMICSESELGLSEEHNGIMVLDPAAPVGASIVDVLGLDDTILDVAVTPNRGDCLSVLGMARDIAAVTGLPLTMPSLKCFENGADASRELVIEVPQADLCPLYHGLVLENTTVAKSPDRLRFRLQSVGVRPISNLVDATNFVLMELGQPLHAFDLDTIRGGRIIVRGADKGERFTTLDGQERVLTEQDITIRDAERVICLGGVMGGLDSEVTDATRRVFLESAVFHPSHIRKAARRLGLHSEASFRFERGVDQLGATFALERAAHLMAELSGGYVRPGLLKNESKTVVPVTITLRKTRAEQLLGLELDNAFCAETLQSLGCAVKETTAGASPEWDVTPPSFRHDLTREADLIEELVRIYGVDRVPPVLPSITHDLERAGLPEPRHLFLGRVKHWGCGAGLHESITYSFVSHKTLDLLGIPAGDAGKRINIMNPLNDDLNVLRTHLAPGLFAALRNNLAQGAPSVRLFEVAAAFSADASSETTAQEVPHLGILLYGNRADQAWAHSNAELDDLDLKGVIEHFLASFSLDGVRYAKSEKPQPWLAPAFNILLGDRVIGFAGRVKPDIADAFHAKKPVWTAEIDLAQVYELHQAVKPSFTPPAIFPPVRRDITFIVPAGISAAAVQDGIAAAKAPLLSDVRLIDSYEPKGKDERNLTFRLTFRHAERTLKDGEVDKQRDAVAAVLQKDLGLRV